MKKTLLCMLTTAAILTSSVSVFAVPTDLKEVYNTATDTVENLDTKGEISPNTHKTVIIRKTYELDGTALDKNSNVVYVDQSTSAYSSAVEFMLDNLNEGTGLTAGYYEATMGTVRTESYESVNFVVGEYSVDPDDKLTILDEAEAYGVDKTDGLTYYKKSFTKTISYDEYNSFQSLKLITGDGAYLKGAIALRSNYTTSSDTHGYAWDKTKLTGSGNVTVALQVYGIPAEFADINLYFSTEATTPTVE